MIDRIVWLANPTGPQVPSNTGTPAVYYNRTAGSVYVPGGRHVVVGPSRTTATGARTTENVTVLGWTTAAPAPQEIQLTGPGGVFRVTDNAGTAPATVYPTTEILPPIGIAVGADHEDPAWALGPIGISVSEPRPRTADNYYPNILAPNASNQTTYSLNQGMVVNDVYSMPIDEPLDNTRLLGTEGLLATGTTPNYRTVFLQRLANPSLPFDATTNPYITVDWLPIDLTVFNGQSAPPADDGSALTFEANDPSDRQRGTQTTGSNVVRFGTRQRGYFRTAPAYGGNYNLWSAVSEVMDPPVPVSSATTVFTSLTNLDHTLGYINSAFHDPNLPGTWKFLGSSNPYTTPTSSYAGSPSKPYPWLTWTNSPYISQFQLMQVPASSPARLTWEFSLLDVKGFYQEQTDEREERNYKRLSGGAPDFNYAPLPSTPYGHLLNFFNSSNHDAAWDTPNTAVDSHATAVGNYYRLFDYVEVPASFSGMQLPIAAGTSQGLTTSCLHNCRPIERRAESMLIRSMTTTI